MPGARHLPDPCALSRNRASDAGRDRRPRTAAGPWDGRRGGPFQAGHIRPLAVLGPKRAPELPEVPTMAELGRPVPDSGVWFGIMAPAGTSPALVTRMAHDLEALASTADTRAKLATQAAVPDFAGPQGSRHASARNSRPGGRSRGVWGSKRSSRLGGGLQRAQAGHQLPRRHPLGHRHQLPVAGPYGSRAAIVVGPCLRQASPVVVQDTDRSGRATVGSLPAPRMSVPG
ncbi:tripartite tricarboxylate transporter substrate-binding protein [Siccirubricoccus deserti]